MPQDSATAEASCVDGTDLTHDLTAGAQVCSSSLSGSFSRERRLCAIHGWWILEGDISARGMDSGIDQSSSGAHGRVVLLPVDPDESARTIRAGLRASGVDAAVIISDTFGRAWREGQTDIAIGIAGMQPILSYIGEVDPHGHEFRVQALCVADELAGAAELVKGNLSRVPVAVVRGYPWEPDDEATLAPVLRDQSRDLFR